MKFPFDLPANREFDAVGFGTNAVDYLISVPFYPSFNSKIELSDYMQLAGGEIATAMVGLKRLGLKTAYAGRFGDDSAGNFGLQSLRDEDVDVRFTEQIKNAKTQIAFIIIDERNGERTVIWHRDKKLAYVKEDAPTEIAALGKVLHLFPHDIEACIELAKKAKETGTIVSIDIDNILSRTEELLSYVDILIASQELSEKFFGINDNHEFLRRLKSKFGCAVTGVTLGENGSLIYCEDRFIETEGYDVPGGCKDTTGAGDSFRAGFLYGILNNDSVEDSAKNANAVAALKCREIGARTALPNKEELQKLLRL
jgi:sugar/nucleoside kinase (ribokinase family)